MRILILTASTGHGHLTAGRALDEALAARSGIVTKVLNVSAAHPLIGGMAALYNYFLRRPPRWMDAFFAFVHHSRLDKLGAALTRRWADKVFRLETPDLVLSVHPMLNFAIASALERHTTMRFAIVLTDPFPPFWKGWAEPRAMLTVVPTEAAADQLRAWGVPQDHILIGGVPIRSTFRRSSSEDSKQATRESLKLEPGRFTLLINAGSAGRPTTEWVLRRLAAATDLHPRLQIVFIAGRNPVLRARIACVDPPFPMAVLGWCDDIAPLLDVSHATFTKPGSLAVHEALAKGVPILIDACQGIMPQERGTADWLEQEGLGWKIHQPEDVVWILRRTTDADWLDKGHRAVHSVSRDATSIAEQLLHVANWTTQAQEVAHAR